MFNGRFKARSIYKKHINENGIIKLHVGSGRHYLPGWINIDVSRKSVKDLDCDVRKGIPFPDSSVDYIFNEHFIEHLSYEEGLQFFIEARRVLKTGGVLRTAFPDLDVLIDVYQKDTWKDMEWVKLIKAHWYPSRCFMLNACIREKGRHKYMYSVEEMQRRLVEAGFNVNSVAVSELKMSRYDALAGLEKRTDSSVVESVKI